MLNKVKRIYLLCLIVALPMLLSCGNEQEPVIRSVKALNERVTLRCVVPFEDAKKNEAFKNFENDVKTILPNYDIQLSFVNGDTNAYNTRLKVLMRSDTPPDVFYSGDGNFTEELYSSKRIQHLEKALNDIGYWNMVIPTAKVILDTKHIYAVPIDEAYYNLMLINTDLFSENNIKIPASFEELKSTVKQFKERNIIPIALGGQNGMSVYNMIESFACTMDDNITRKILRDNDAFTGHNFSQAATAVKQLIELGAFQERVETISDQDAEDLFYSSKAAIYCTSSETLNIANNQLSVNVAVLYYPQLCQINGSIPSCVVSGGTKKDSGLLVSASTKYPTEAVQLAVEMSKYYNKYLYEKLGDGAIIYNLEDMGWTPSIAPDLGTSELMMNIKQKGNVNTGLFGYNISADKEKSIAEASTAFMTGLLSVNDYLEELNLNLRSE